MTEASSAPPTSQAEPGKLYGGEFQPDQRNNPRTIIANWVQPNTRVLEVGPGDGVVGAWLRANRGCHVVGVEYVPTAADLARPNFDAMLTGSIEDPAVLDQVRAYAAFDSIIFADVLEHLVDPWATLRTMRPLLSPQGQVLVSIPNIAHWTARVNLLRGKFDYTDGYLMDRTHLRWFTFKSARQLAARGGYTIATEDVVYKPRFARFWRNGNGFQIVLRLVPEPA